MRGVRHGRGSVKRDNTGTAEPTRHRPPPERAEGTARVLNRRRHRAKRAACRQVTPSDDGHIKTVSAISISHPVIETKSSASAVLKWTRLVVANACKSIRSSVHNEHALRN